jgi:hypothetical protein
MWLELYALKPLKMKRTFLVFIISLWASHGLFAQQYDNDPSAQGSGSSWPANKHGNKLGKIDINRVRFGAYFAPNSSWMHPTSSKSDDNNYYINSNGSKLGYSWGLIADYYFTENYGISTGFNINTTGGELLNTATALLDTTKANTVKKADFNYTLQYLEIPCGLKLHSDALGKSGISIYGLIGLTLGINIGAKVDYTVNYRDASNINQTLTGNGEKLKGTLATAPIMLQMNLGGGFEYPIKQKLAFYFGLYFNNGFLPNVVSPDKFTMGYSPANFSGTNTRLNSLAFRLGLLF